MSVGASKLNEEKADIIKNLLKMGDYTHQQIADLFGVSREMITSINNGRRWNDDIKSFVMKSNDLRDFGRPKKDKQIDYITIHYNDGTELDLR
jgi:hypothetical protein